MYDLRAFQLPQYCARVWLALCCLLGAVQIAQAAKLPDFKQTGVTITGNSAKVGMTGNGGPAWGSTIPISPTAGGWSYAGNYGIPQAAKGTTMNMGASGDVFFSGTKYPFQAGYTVPASNVFAGLKTAAEVAGGALGGPIGLALIVGSLSAPYIKQWFDESDLRVKPDGSGIQKGDPNYCATNCYRWRGNIYIPWQATPTLACQAWVAVNANRSFISVQAVQESAGRWSCTSRYGNEPNTMTFELVRESRAPDLVKSWFDIPSLSDISPYMTPRPFDPRVIPEILDRGGDIPMPSPTITGPSSLPGPQQVIKNPDGTTTTINTTHNYQITGDTITNITNITSTTITNSSSQIISTSTSTVTPSTTQTNEDQFDLCKKYPDSVACASKTKLDELIDAAKKTDCQKDPNGVGCTLDVPTGEIPKSTVNITYASESHFGGGSCPSDKTMQIHGGPSVTVANWTVICDQINTWVRPLVLVLAAFGALMVLAPGLREGTA